MRVPAIRGFFAGTILIALPLAATHSSAQGFLDQLERELEAGEAAPVEAERVEPAAAPPAVARPRTPGYLGLVVDEVSGVLRVELVREGGAAEKAGLRTGDIVQEIDGRPVTSLDAMGARLAPHGAGDRVVIRVRRGEITLLTNAILAPRPAAPRLGEAGTEPAPVDALDALGELDRLLDKTPPPPSSAELAAPAAAGKIAPARIEALEDEIRAIHRRIAELEREIAEITPAPES